jgi:hypothetical protein
MLQETIHADRSTGNVARAPDIAAWKRAIRREIPEYSMRGAALCARRSEKFRIGNNGA